MPPFFERLFAELIEEPAAEKATAPEEKLKDGGLCDEGLRIASDESRD